MKRLVEIENYNRRHGAAVAVLGSLNIIILFDGNNPQARNNCEQLKYLRSNNNNNINSLGITSRRRRFSSSKIFRKLFSSIPPKKKRKKSQFTCTYGALYETRSLFMSITRSLTRNVDYYTNGIGFSVVDVHLYYGLVYRYTWYIWECGKGNVVIFQR